ncbi:MAG TPA: hypothetical protein VJI97_02235 [Candidatus Nanoarchaeia archaeon]|nr:hypothetical protein [Candidatus Nanoarchaeia archaeon]
MKTLYVFGNEFLDDDKLAGIVSNNLKGNFKVERCRSPDDLLDAGKEIVILDVVKGIKEPIIIKDISKIKSRNLMSLHDFDLGFFLKLMEGMGINKKIKIIGIPQKGNAKDIAKEVERWI